MVTEQWQGHHPPPRTHQEFRALLDAGLLITTGGKPLVRRSYSVCGAGLLGSRDGAETCWCAIPCPTCPARVGRACRRPSEHAVFGNRPHERRARLAQAETDRRARDGDPDLPARWRPARPTAEDQPGLW